MEDAIYMMTIAYRFSQKYWANRADYSWWLRDAFDVGKTKAMDGLISFHTYRSLRFDSDLIFWYSARTPEAILSAKEWLNETMGDVASASFSMLSLYEHSPYLKAAGSLENTLKFAPLNYFVAYPMSKTPDWYLVDFEERKRIMAEHIGMAASHPEAREIRSYTTYSYGLGDQEFVVLYEVDSLVKWSHVTAKLREATARKWTAKEEPIFVGILSDPLRL
ncbi:MAG TPA: chlorite dismutase family protein [Thermoplasmataceae archaeon]|nr:chlorite dismutase family protein [Thermoplasmatales archaeon AK]HLH86276.1 chlorite dismutase family protein [Thermoplasmataceae archaeon]